MGQGKSVAQGYHAVKQIASSQASQLASAITHHGYQHPHLIALFVDKIDGNGASQEGTL
jgi:hypothetical protein